MIYYVFDLVFEFCLVLLCFFDVFGDELIDCGGRKGIESIMIFGSFLEGFGYGWKCWCVGLKCWDVFVDRSLVVDFFGVLKFVYDF